MSLHSSNTWNKTNKSGTRGRGKGAHGSKPKDENDDYDDENDLGVFDSDNIRAALSQMNYKVAYVAFNVCAPSIT
jgi:hypothetical protein